MNQVKIYNSIHEIDAKSWNALIDDSPFWKHAFLAALEDNRCLGEHTGWFPHYICIEDSSQNEIVACLPSFIKTNSYGEYIFDWQWANAYAENSLPYYPKLTNAVPFSPVSAPKLLVKTSQQRLKIALLEIFKNLADTNRLSSAHSLFTPEEELSSWSSKEFLIRHSFQYHWYNNGYQEFDDFLSELKGKKRRQITKERKEVFDQGLKIKILEPEQLNASVAKVFYQFYLTTIDKKFSYAYLSEDFFVSLFENCPESVLLIMADDSFSKPVAASLSLQNEKSIFGRYWGSNSNYKQLHFELCYYQLIEETIRRGLSKLEAGAQGEHKIARGFQPTLTYSAHYIRHPEFQQAIKAFVEEEKNLVAMEIRRAQEASPFKEAK